MLQKIQFYKFHGTGNDFIILRNLSEELVLNGQDIRLMCHRQFGIGADGLMILNPSDKFDFHMQYFNADGIEGSMCGNGGRCIAAFAQMKGLVEKSTKFEAIDGIHQAQIHTRINRAWDISLKLNNVRKFERKGEDFLIDTGSPHYICFVKDLDKTDVLTEGKIIRYNSSISENGVNVNFVEEREGHIYVKTYERGVENITLSCGTGVTASAIALAIKQQANFNEVIVNTIGGKLKVRFEKDELGYNDIWLNGPAEFVYSGEYEI